MKISREIFNMMAGIFYVCMSIVNEFIQKSFKSKKPLKPKTLIQWFKWWESIHGRDDENLFKIWI